MAESRRRFIKVDQLFRHIEFIIAWRGGLTFGETGDDDDAAAAAIDDISDCIPLLGIEGLGGDIAENDQVLPAIPVVIKERRAG